MRTWLKFFGFISFAGLVGPFGLGASCTGNLGTNEGGGTGGTAGSPEPGGTGANASGGGVPDSGAPACDSGADEDRDKDGFTVAQGDCNDCDPFVNANAIELATPVDASGSSPEPVDEDCDGTVDEPEETCDQELALDDLDPVAAARAVELCKQSSGAGDWGVLSATWVLLDGSPPPTEDAKLANFHLGHGLLSGFGSNVRPRGGERLLALSSGTARQPTEPGFQGLNGFSKNYTSGQVPGFPKKPPSCPDLVPGRPVDPTALEIRIRAPSNAHGFSFNVKYTTFDWPEVCQDFNDFFLALITPPPQGKVDGNILFDAQGAPMSVNNAFIDVCGCQGGRPCVLGNQTFACSRGESDLLDSGFEGHAATGWLVTSVPVEPNQEFTVRWGAYDAGAYDLDSTGLIDNWRWISAPGTVVNTQVVPAPQP